MGVVALIEHDGCVLVDRRSDDGAWAFVGGRVEEDESVLGALHRFFARDDLAALDLWPAATPIRDAYLAFDGTPLIT